MQRELAELRQAAEQRELTARREAEARQVEVVAQLEAEAQRELAARREAEAQREQAMLHAAEAQRELAALRAAAEQREIAARREAEERQTEAAARRQSDAQRDAAASRDREAHRELAARLATDARRTPAARPELQLAPTKTPLMFIPRREPRQDQSHPALPPEPSQPLAAQPEISSQRQPVIEKPATPNRAAALSARLQMIIPAPEKSSNAHAGSDHVGDDHKNRDRRVSAQTPATLWSEGLSQALACTIRDRSPSGAMLEFPKERYSDGITDIAVGDELTLTVSSSQERTSVVCVVVRIDGRRCGVRFRGQFHTQVNKPRKSLKDKPEKAVKSRFASGGTASRR